MADVIIVGGGVIGCAVAYYLTAAGASDVLPREQWAETTLQEVLYVVWMVGRRKPIAQPQEFRHGKEEAAVNR